MSNSYIKKILKKTVYKSLLNKRGSFTYFGEKVFFPRGSTTFSLAIKDGIYEHDILKFILNNIKDHSTYLDIGANIGLMSIPVLKQNKTINAISIEASPQTFAFLKKTRDQSDLRSRWSVYNSAATDVNKEVDFYIASSANGAFESMQDTSRVNFSGKIKVQGITIDQLWLDVSTPQVSVIKVDIEGADLLALNGAKACIASCKPMIIMEWNKTNIQAYKFRHADLMDFCKQMNYTCFALPSLIPVNNATELGLQTIITENFLLAP